MDLEQTAIERIRAGSRLSMIVYKKPLVCTYSGGKDSDVLLELFKRSGIEFEVHHSHTTADAPQTVLHIRKKFKELELLGIKCDIEMPTYRGKRTSMWELIPLKRIPPSRLMRYCCAVLKETGCKRRVMATGVRWDESKQRSERESFELYGSTKTQRSSIEEEIMLLNDNGKMRELEEVCLKKQKTIVNAIIDWTTHDIWDYIRSEQIEYNPLYDFGYHRVGCIGCPMAGKSRYKEFADFPSYQRAYIRSFSKMLEILKEEWQTPPKWKSGEEVFHWWMESKNIIGQMQLEFD